MGRLSKTRFLDIQLFPSRLYLLIGIVIMLSGILIVRLAYLQIVQNKRYQTLSLKNQLAVIPIPPPRGLITDRNGVILAENIPVYVLEIIPGHVKNLPDTLKNLETLIPNISKIDEENFIKLKRQNRPYVSIPLKMNLSQEEVARFAVNQYKFSGVSIKARLMRYYPLKELMAPITGYVSRINLEELRKVNATNYRGTSFIGKTGIEKFYEDILHGEVGYQEVETDVSGRTLRVVNKHPPIAGKKLALTIDSRLQKIAYDAFQGKRGALVAINPNNGDILAFVSSPSYDPNLFVRGISNKNYHDLAFTIEKPLFNRAIRGLYPPASTIKPFMGTIALNTGAANEQFSVFDPGWFRLPGIKHPYRDWNHRGHGMVNLKRAITVSCDTYFYHVGSKMGIKLIAPMLRKFGFGAKTNVDIDEEAAGVVPSIEWKRQNKKESWYPGDTVISSIGQGFTLITPLQLAHAIGILSLHGKRKTPHFLMTSTTNEQNIESYKQHHSTQIKLNDDRYWNIIIEAMRAVIESYEGTGRPKFGIQSVYTVAAKTGTAQVYSGHQFEKLSYENIPEAYRDNSLFVAFAPVEAPQIALAVVVENDKAAAHVARDVLDAYFRFYPPVNDNLIEQSPHENPQ